MINDSTIITVTNKSVHCDLEDEVVILEMDEGIYYGLNPVGAFIWKEIQQPKTVAEIRKAVLAEYEVEEEVCQKDLLELLEDLLDKGLIEVKE